MSKVVAVDVPFCAPGYACDNSSDARSQERGLTSPITPTATKELKRNDSFLLPGFAKFIVIKKPATKERSGINPFTKEPTVFKARPLEKSFGLVLLKQPRTLSEEAHRAAAYLAAAFRRLEPMTEHKFKIGQLVPFRPKASRGINAPLHCPYRITRTAPPEPIPD